MYEIVVGRNETDKRKFGDKGTFLLGKHYVKMGQATSLSNNIYMDAVRPHVVFVVGKRGSGKSYSASAIAEGMMCLDPDIRENLSIVLLDTMGIFWTMKFENREDAELLKKWNIAYSKLNIQVYTPAGHYEQFREKGISDFPFSIKTSELEVNDWLMTFGLGVNDPVSIAISRALDKLAGTEYAISDIVGEIKKNQNTDQHVKDAAENLFMNANNWGLFDDKGTKFSDLVLGGQVTVLDVSCYSALSGADSIRALVIGLVSKKLFEERMSVRRMEEYRKIKAAMTIEEEKVDKLKVPLIWIMVDEAHEFLPLKGRTSATEPLLTLLREGRQPGISLILATQQPGQIHTDVMTQSDIIIAHRLTSKIDIDSLGMLMQTYMRENLDKLLAELPDVKGSALIFDDTNERMYPSQIRPKMTWHGGSSPTAIREKEELFLFPR
ncbi:ATP-binding protein [Candidatus Woesearchaeota archaeon]|nr:ATP-binding protein [Candidatus Woesearchaeota archaeon]